LHRSKKTGNCKKFISKVQKTKIKN
jgi:hypothetical protein